MKNKLLEAKTAKQMLEIYSDPENQDRFHVGYVLAVQNDVVLEYNIGIHGEYDGFSAERIETICKIDSDTEYLNDLAILGRGKQKDVDISITGDIFFDILNKTKNENMVSVVWMVSEDAPVIGYILDVSDKEASMKLVAGNGEVLGNKKIALQDIFRIMVDDCDCRDIAVLYEYKNIS